jgi:hypothetical protein
MAECIVGSLSTERRMCQSSQLCSSGHQIQDFARVLRVQFECK